MSPKSYLDKKTPRRKLRTFPDGQALDMQARKKLSDKVETTANGKCFVIQPFDRGGFDRRYEDIIAPAVEAAGLLPYRVDRDPCVVVPIEEVEKGISSAHAAVADISLDNPNIWYEVGYAQAAAIPIVLICSAERQSFPFDIQHRNILVYEKESRRDFERLQQEITARLRALVAKEQERLTNDIRRTRMLELAALVMKTPYYDISLVEEVLQVVEDAGRVDVRDISLRRSLTSATIASIIERMEKEGILGHSGESYHLTDLGKEMSGTLSRYLRPNGLA